MKSHVDGESENRFEVSIEDYNKELTEDEDLEGHVVDCNLIIHESEIKFNLRDDVFKSADFWLQQGSKIQSSKGLAKGKNT